MKRLGVLLSGIVALVSLILAGSLLADGPSLAIRLSGGVTEDYVVEDVERMTFSAGVLDVVTTSQTDDYQLDGILRIEFCWPEMAGIPDPYRPPMSEGVSYLRQNQPNPFSPRTLISFENPQREQVQLSVYSVEGKLVRKLISDSRPAGSHTVEWDGCDENGDRVASGTYFCRLSAPGIAESKKLILTR